MKLHSDGVADTMNIAYDFAQTLRAGDTVALFGEVGAGKTHFVKGLASFLCPGQTVTSPTFTIVHEYGGKPPLVHFDMYRIECYDQLYSTGFFDYLQSDCICVIEWSENIENVLPECFYRVTLEKDGETGRNISICEEGAAL